MPRYINVDPRYGAEEPISSIEHYWKQNPDGLFVIRHDSQIVEVWVDGESEPPIDLPVMRGTTCWFAIVAERVEENG